MLKVGQLVRLSCSLDNPFAPEWMHKLHGTWWKVRESPWELDSRKVLLANGKGEEIVALPIFLETVSQTALRAHIDELAKELSALELLPYA